MSRSDGVIEYVLREAVKARREVFGLLFYNSADTTLTFVRSGGLLDVEGKGHAEFRLRLNPERVWCSDEDRPKRIIDSLLQKGLIVETRTAT